MFPEVRKNKETSPLGKILAVVGVKPINGIQMRSPDLAVAICRLRFFAAMA